MLSVWAGESARQAGPRLGGDRRAGDHGPGDGPSLLGESQLGDPARPGLRASVAMDQATPLPEYLKLYDARYFTGNGTVSAYDDYAQYRPMLYNWAQMV